MTTLRSAEDLTAQLHGAFPAMAEEEGRVDVEHVDASTIRIRMRAAEHHLRPGATVSGPALFSLVDTVAWLMTLAHLEPGRDALTVSASVQFLRRPAAGTLIGEGRLLRMGRRFSVTDVLVHAGDPSAGAGGPSSGAGESGGDPSGPGEAGGDPSGAGFGDPSGPGGGAGGPTGAGIAEAGGDPSGAGSDPSGPGGGEAGGPTGAGGAEAGTAEAGTAEAGGPSGAARPEPYVQATVTYAPI